LDGSRIVFKYIVHDLMKNKQTFSVDSFLSVVLRQIEVDLSSR